jgi:nicotinate-nucleotide adenylyltransferase
VIGLFGGAFNPPHFGHLALARGALATFDLASLEVLVSGGPAHKPVDCPVEVRVALAELAFAGLERTVVRADPYRYTVDLLRAERPADAIFLVGADQYRDFDTWKDPRAVLELARLGVATRSGVERPPLRPEHEGRVVFFEIDSPPIASRELRERAARGASLAGDVPPDVLREIERRGLYRAPGYTGRSDDEDSTD